MSESRRYIDIEVYERVAEPHKRERSSAWCTAIGLQNVDGLRASECLKKTFVKNIDGDTTPHWKPSEIEQVIIPKLLKSNQEIISIKIKKCFALKAVSKQSLDETKIMVEREIEKGGES